MAKDFEALASGLKTEWSDDTKREYEESVAAFDREIEARLAVGAALALARADAGLSQEALARASRVQQAEISRIERGHANPTLDTLARLAGAMGRTVSLDVVSEELA
ncbi:MAG: XRE family transcriptional regulator [Actinobacteria bacterium HGW-Actinobacteria-4]|nr:MAG: XRE family transcriptional regulator [Actinobacteria bacterium HGW-Actinobacteria-4]